MAGCAVPAVVVVCEVILVTRAPDGSGMLPAELVRVLTPLPLVPSDDTPGLGLLSSGRGDSEPDGQSWKSLGPPSPTTQPRQEVGEWLSHHGCPQQGPQLPRAGLRSTSLGSKHNPSEIGALPETSAVDVFFGFLTRGNDDILSQTHTKMLIDSRTLGRRLHDLDGNLAFQGKN